MFPAFLSTSKTIVFFTEPHALEYFATKNNSNYKIPPRICSWREKFKLLIENDRLLVISEILGLYNMYLQEERSLKTAKIDTAFELSSEQLESVKIALEKRFNKKVVIEQNIDLTLLAGAVVRVDDLVIDGSLKEQLRKLETQLI